jgi:phosphate acyltransferase
MGSDTSPEILFDALPAIADNLPEKVSFTLFATKEILADRPQHPLFTFIPVEEVVAMDEDPLTAIRKKKNSSISIAMKYLKEGKISALISGGNTGALIASAKLTLPMLPGIKRAALLALLPTERKPIAVLDVGANISFKTEHLIQFALMGIAYQKSRGIANPKVGLLNIGPEAIKGTPILREVYQKLIELNKEESIFLGNIEGKAVFRGDLDVLVTDGFTGNIFLKTAEGIAAFISKELEQIEEGGEKLKEILTTLKRHLDYSEYPGAILCGVNGIVIKCHGDFSPQALNNSIRGTIRLLEHDFLEKIKIQLATLFF